MLVQNAEPSMRAAYYNAGVGVMAYDACIQVNRLKLDDDPRGPRPSIASVWEHCDVRRLDEESQLTALEAYITVLLSGLAGQLIRLEFDAGITRRCSPQQALVRRYAAKAAAADDWLTDKAYALAAGYLADRDGGRTGNTLRRLWNVANDKLREPPHRFRLHRLASELNRMGELYSWEIERVLIDAAS